MLQLQGVLLRVYDAQVEAPCFEARNFEFKMLCQGLPTEDLLEEPESNKSLPCKKKPYIMPLWTSLCALDENVPCSCFSDCHERPTAFKSNIEAWSLHTSIKV